MATIKTTQDDYTLAITLSRPDVRNALNPLMIQELSEVFTSVDDHLRCVVLKGEGDSFCSGADLNWMKASVDFSKEENRQDAADLFHLFELVDTCPIPVVTIVHGHALGGAIGLVSASDYVISEKETLFSFSEVKIGLVPSCIAPFVLKKVGQSWARAMFLSAERFTSLKAFQMGLIHDITEGKDHLDKLSTQVINSLISASPNAVKRCKSLLGELDKGFNKELAINVLADIRITKEAQEGIKSFLEKKPPPWTPL